jgi:Ice-binding-like
MKTSRNGPTTIGPATAILVAALMASCGGNDGSTSAAAPAGSDAASAAAAGTTNTACSASGCPNLGTASDYVILAKSAVSTVPPSAVTGNIGLSPAATTFLTGWSLVSESTDTFDTSVQVAAPSKLYAADMTGGTTSPALTTAVSDMQAAYTAAAALAPSGGGLVTSCPGVAHGTIGAISDVNDGGALVGGVYTCAVNVTIPGNLTLMGSATDVWVFQITGTLTQASGTQVLLTGGALPQNVFWQVSGAVTVGTTAVMQGVVLAQTNIAVQTGATVTGRLLAQTAVTLDSATVTAP